ncbi:Pentatricopeptide repeat-containing protein [Quillaja saponaria]|uniref:Pentatricopeptide repeat-containing protein n=1 Tax=Quillaja saponaria TaxID=32244 RepID=A0AAD7VEU6_QUISA|nr:Pentatricopeptide repeat-containing protein [Quillaja saponaria]
MKKINYSSAEFALWIDLISKTKGVAAAENYFNHLPPSSKNQMPYGALFNCYCKEIMSDKAFALFKKIKELNYLSPLAFNNLMSLYMRMSQPERVPSLVDEMKQRNIPLSNVTCSIWMNSYASLNDIECVERVYEEINKEDNDKVSWNTYSNLATIYVKAELFEKAESTLKKLKEEMKPQDRDAYHCLISLYAGTYNLDEVHRVWKCLGHPLASPT